MSMPPSSPAFTSPAPSPCRSGSHRYPRRTVPRSPTLRIVPWLDPVADPHGVHPC